MIDKTKDLPTFIIQQSTHRPYLSLCLMSASLAVVFALGYFARPVGSTPPIITDLGPTIEQVQALNQLVSSRVMIADVLTGEDEGYRGAWLIKGDALIGVDLSRAEISGIDREKRTAVLTLPNPTVVSARVDHEHTKTWDMQSTSWKPWPFKPGDPKSLQDRSMFHAQKLIEFAGARSEVLDLAKKSAEQSLTGFYRTINWRVEIKWKP